MNNYEDNFWNCPSCNTSLWKEKSQTGNYCHVCGTQVRVKTFNREFDWDQKTFEAAILGFIKGFVIAGLIGLFFGFGLIAGIIWGIIWGYYRYHTGTPNSLYGEKYLDNN